MEKSGCCCQYQVCPVEAPVSLSSAADEKTKESKETENSIYLSPVTLVLPVSFVPIQVGLLQGEATQPAAQREEEDGERPRGGAKTPQRVEEGRVLRHSKSQV